MSYTPAQLLADKADKDAIAVTHVVTHFSLTHTHLCSPCPIRDSGWDPASLATKQRYVCILADLDCPLMSVSVSPHTHTLTHAHICTHTHAHMHTHMPNMEN